MSFLTPSRPHVTSYNITADFMFKLYYNPGLTAAPYWTSLHKCCNKTGKHKRHWSVQIYCHCSAMSEVIKKRYNINRDYPLPYIMHITNCKPPTSHPFWVLCSIQRSALRLWIRSKLWPCIRNKEQTDRFDFMYVRWSAPNSSSFSSSNIGHCPDESCIFNQSDEVL